MKNDIVNKLKGVTAGGNNSEQTVVYFLVESYKIIEQVNRLPDFELIRFYRNWVCHSVLLKDSQKIFEEVYVIIRAEKYLNLEKRHNDEMPAFAELIDDAVSKAFSNYSFKKLKKEIEKFSKEFLNGSPPDWKNFSANLYEILINVPLIIKKDNEKFFRFEVIKIDGKEPFNGLRIQITFPGGWIRTGARDIFFEL